MAENNLNVPQDLVMEEILPKLPVKSLIRFKCISKSWKALFTTAYFVSKQMSTSSVKYKKNPLIMFSILEGRLHRIELHSNGNPSPNLFKPFEDQDVSLIFGPCNGIFCVLSCKVDLILWNPAARQVKFIPPPVSPPLSLPGT